MSRIYQSNGKIKYRGPSVHLPFPNSPASTLSKCSALTSVCIRPLQLGAQTMLRSLVCCGI